ncbi:MAG: GNAT family N-acetyltransferase [candidate division Zixibacteria bacterium]|nr:GNAT family N-acetyltransferase [candidate division Zixibacteria bacterium]
MIKIREYKPEDEPGWLKCRLLSFFDSAYHDDVQLRKASYDNPLIDLVAVDGGRIAGLIEIECEFVPCDICREGEFPAGMIWNLAVRPEYRRQKLATKLLDEAAWRAREKKIKRFEAYTRDDDFVLAWYKRNGFRKVMSYLHVYMDFDEQSEVLKSSIADLKPVHVLAHYTGDDTEMIRKRFKRVHDCNLLELKL